jgi:hypothetical protein
MKADHIVSRRRLNIVMDHIFESGQPILQVTGCNRSGLTFKDNSAFV